MSGWSAGQALVASVIKDPEFERLHPRGRDGRFITKGGYVKFLDIKVNMWRLAKVEDIQSDGKIKVSYTGSGGKPTEELMKKSWLYHADAPKATLNPAGWKKVGAQAGSNVGGFFEDKNGQKWYVKTPQSKLHTGNENLMNRLYVKAGAPAPETAVSPNGKNFLTKIEDSVDWHTITGDRLETVQKIAAKNFVVDAWLANWDAPLNDNVRVTPDNVVLRVDAGGAGMFRARGERRMLTMDVKELQSMRDPNMSGRSGGATLYAKVTQDDEINAAKRILAINPDDIKSMVSEEGLPQQLATELIARRAWLATHYGLELPESTEAGKAALQALAEAKTAAEKEAAEAAIKALIKIAPDGPVALGPGAPVWIKDKKVGSLNAGTKVPDLMVVDWQTEHLISFKSKDGKTEYTVKATDTAAFEVLRENNASANVAYASGEKPQVGDRVDQKTGGPGVVTEMFPLYMRVMGDDGKSRVSKIAQNTLLAKVGEHDKTAVALSGNAAAAAIGKHADLSNADAKFPLIAFSLPHRANVLVVSYDDTTKKAKIMLSNGGAATVPADKLYDNDSVNRETIAALPVATKRRVVRSPRTPAPVDVNTLPPIDVKPNRSVKVTLEAGDRLLKAKDKSTLRFLIIRRDGTVEYAGSNKSGTDMEGVVDSNLKHDYSQIRAFLDSPGPLTDITPAKYDLAVHELGPKSLKFNKRRANVNNSISGLDPDEVRKLADKHAGDLSKFTRWDVQDKTPKVTREIKFNFTPETGDEMISMVDSGSPRIGLKNNVISYYGYTDDDDLTEDGARTAKQKVEDLLADETNYTYLPRFWLKRRDGSVYDLGYGAEFAEDESKWKDAKQADLTKIHAINDDYWYSGYGNPEPKETLSDGTVVRYSTKGSDLGTGVTGLAQKRAYLTGELPDDQKIVRRSYWSNNPKLNYDGTGGSGAILTALQKATDQWDKGNPAAKDAAAQKVPSGAARIYYTPNLDAFPEGKRLFRQKVHGAAASTTDAWELIVKQSDGLWLRVDADLKGGAAYFSGSRMLDPDISTAGPVPGVVGDTRAFTHQELAKFPAGSKVTRPGDSDGDIDEYVKDDELMWRLERDAYPEFYTDTELADLGAVKVETLPAPPPSDSDPIVDFTETAGYKALTHQVSTSREHINDGTLDDTIHEVMNTPIKSGVGYGASSLHTLPDGTVHGDPFMAQFAKKYEGDQQVLNAPAPMFNAIKAMTGHPSMHRGVSAADQRDAIKHGDHFNGTGAYGNGVYTAADRSVTSSYGGAKVELTPKPGAKGIQNDELYLSQAEDMAKAIRDRADVLAATTSLPTAQEIATMDLTGKNDKETQEAVDFLMNSILSARGLTSTTDADRKEILDRGTVKAAIAYHVAFRKAGLQSVISTERAGYYSANDEKISLLVRQTPPAGSGTAADVGTLALEFEAPWSQGSTNFGRAQAKKLDVTRDYMVKSSLRNAAPGKTWSSSANERIRQQYNSGWWKDNFSEHLEASGVGEAIADNASDWQAALEKARKLDSRITFISDPGRWALASGYDYFYIPGQDYYIFTHRAGFIVKK